MSQVVRLPVGDTEETDGGPLRLDAPYEELCALETPLTRESDA